MFLRLAIVVALPLLLSSCGSSYSAPPAPTTYTIGGTVSGLTGSGLVLQDNGGNNISVTASGSFTFTTAVASGGAYAVTVLTQPSNPVQNCVVTGGSGAASANVTNVQVTCTLVTGPFTIGGTVTNLSGAGNSLVLQDNGGNNLSVTANGGFIFTTAVASGGPYAVTVSTQPSTPAQTCSVANGTGTANGNVTNIAVNCGHNEWAWMSGSNVPNQTGTYGTLGVAAAATVPGFRNFGAVSWTDTSGNLWLFGGNELVANPATNYSGDLNDLWKYNIVSGQWTWVSGSSSFNQPGNYGTLNTAAATNVPGARDSGVTWIDSSGNLWLFGGQGIDSAGTYGYLNDLWEYSVSSNQWTWKGGSNTVNSNGNFGALNVAAATNVPSARGFSTVQNINGEVWLFGGFGNDSESPGVQDNLNDLWEFTISSGVWTWMGGSKLVDEVSVYGVKGTAAPANIPGARYSTATWTDTSGNFWLFGGSNEEADGMTVDFLNDLWEYSTVSKEWTWFNGSNALNQLGTYGVLGTAASGNTPGARGNLFSWTDPSGNFWLFGGFGSDSAAVQVELNDLWEYSVSTNEWTWKNGPNTGNGNGAFGTLGQLAPGNLPASRDGGASWTDASGNLWLFSGEGTNTFNDLWMYLP
jgi:N-acetylneuraminic acid mutarotase